MFNENFIRGKKNLLSSITSLESLKKLANKNKHQGGDQIHNADGWIICRWISAHTSLAASSPSSILQDVPYILRSKKNIALSY